jgi:fluoride ion exporter CrcB/FEX
MNKVFLVGAGGAIGSMLRYWFSGIVRFGIIAALKNA